MRGKIPLLVFWVLLPLGCLPAIAQALGQPVRSDEDILRRGTNSSWSDIAKQDVQYNAPPLARDNMQNHDQWTHNPGDGDFWSWLFRSNPRTNTGPQSTNTATKPQFWDDFWFVLVTAIRYTVWFLLALIVITAVAWTLKNQEMFLRIPRNRKPQDYEDIAAQRAKYSDLPVELEQGLVGLKAHAASLRAQGQYSRAIVYLFSYLLVELDSARCISLAKGKTNYRYLRELARAPTLEPRFRRVIVLFEEAYFGSKTISQSQFDEVWQDLPDFETAIKNSVGLDQHSEEDRNSKDLASKGPLAGAVP